MIYVVDDFLPEEKFNALCDYCEHNDFKIVESPGKKFSVLEVPDWMIAEMTIEGHEMVFGFIRNAYKGFDNDWRIHADNIIQGHKVDLATVLYINYAKGVTENGTAFWTHWKHGIKLPKDTPVEEFNRLLAEDSNAVEQWKQNAYVGARQNRLLTYDANYFHSKYPNEITQGVRIVLAAFYSKINP